MKVVNVSNGNYKVTVQDGGVITLNTGTAVGTVIITGDLTVLGTTTTVDTANMTIEDNIIFPINMFTNQNHKENLDRANFCLERVNLAGKNKLFPAELSGGMKKRVGIARAIAMNPKYLFVDEPNSGLDPKTAIVIDELIQELTTE